MSKTILLVDDQRDARAILGAILKTEPSWQLAEASGGHEAIDLLCSGLKPQLCMVDLMMSDGGGLEFLRRIRRDRELRSLRVIVTSANRDRDTVLELAKLGIDGYLLKPLEADKVLAAVRPIMAAVPDPGAEPAVLRDLLSKFALIVDDDPVSREAVAAIVKDQPHWQVLEAPDGKTALEILRSGNRPNLCFIDLNMPEMDGIALLREIRGDPELRDLRVVVTSGVRERDKIVALAHLQIQTYLLKPVDPGKVRAALTAAF